MKHVVPETPPDYDKTRIVERPDGFFWIEKGDGQYHGPFDTLMEAVEDMNYTDESDYEPGETLEEAEEELGISDWVDPDTGLPAEDSLHHIEDDH
jgi:hypothetical protein